MTEHFAESEWIRFVRLGAATQAATTQAMHAHLEQGCSECLRERGFLAGLEATLRVDRDLVPSALHQRALAVPASWPRTPRTAWARGLHLAFDSFTAPRPATVRGGGQPRRHCVYELGRRGGSLEVMVERVGSRSGWSVLGQVLTPNGEGWANCRVRLSESVPAPASVPEPPLPAVTATNHLGEFSFVRDDAGPWQLDVRTGERSWQVAPVLVP